MAGDITTIARPYAEAAFERAKETGQVEAWSDALGRLAAVAGDPQMVALIANPNVSRETIRDITLEVCGEDLPEEVANLLRLLADNARLAAVPEIARLFEVSRSADEGMRRVTVRSAFEIDEAQRAALATALSSRLGGQVELTVETDSALIGGLEIRAGDLVIDDTVRGKIDRLANALQF
ncbi:F0F1 ATP synthase subunit delta [Marichromatium gracile]|uniref:ATP synthase subunit delta n=1 Tax=Marichromatium gracile TaxID=1048 RepID=A0A4V2WAM2_MARGR|nr:MULTISPECIES: F0F1 ATP synthase subunit delta [Marichromatium]MBO8086467.1 F0F1 ATP synthase subunit delta [Marichromatium sp.]KXX66034.1 ATP synthase F1 subunit delta [Marichromatium gracile]MBK1707761.1 F0F1 ATP synthase subunit delta [Marichromatium gracile]MCF1183829.1 F0F1 ATP synthase subunit delta [Marichromatium gracile]RNE92124.1 F0F1 ATP synthase subunit delta [Marichromatium sp. AB31]